MMIVRDWKIKDNMLMGAVYGSSRYENGTRIHTSAIVTAAVDEGVFLIRTENSVYECHGEDYIGTEEDLNRFMNWCLESAGQATKQITKQ